MLSERLLTMLREWYRRARPKTWLFPGASPDQPFTRAAVAHACQRGRQRSGLSKPVTAHSLRHAFAVHEPASRRSSALARGARRGGRGAGRGLRRCRRGRAPPLADRARDAVRPRRGLLRALDRHGRALADRREPRGGAGAVPPHGGLPLPHLGLERHGARCGEPVAVALVSGLAFAQMLECKT